MIKNYLKIAWRNLWKNKMFSLINIIGLSIGIAFTMLIAAYIWGELQVNHQLRNEDSQYMILSKWKDPNMANYANSIAELPAALKANYPSLVVNYYRSDLIITNVSKGDKVFMENLQIGDSTLLKMYGFKLVYGDELTALRGPFSVVVTPRTALKYFGKTDVVGQTLDFENVEGAKHAFLITGVLKDTIKNTVTSLNNDYNFFFNSDAAKFFKRDFVGWNYFNLQTYIEIRKDVDPKMVESAMLGLIKKNAPEQTVKNLTPYLVSLKDYHQEAHNGLVKKTIQTLSCIALFILIMAIINFVNICIGRSSSRMKEMGLRKVIGGSRKQIIWQFLSESIFMVFLSTLLAVIIYYFARPYFSGVLNKDIMPLFKFPVYFAFIPFLFALIIGFIAGIYPALVLSALKSIDSLKGKLSSVKDNVLFRKTLVAFQFTTATIVFIGALIVSQQVSLFFSDNLGYNKNYVVYAQVLRDWNHAGVQKMEAARSQLAKLPQISDVTLSFDIPNGNVGGISPVYRQGANSAQAINSLELVADNHYATVFDIPLLSGTFFNPLYTVADSSRVVINLAEAKALGWKDPNDAIGKKIILEGMPFIVCGVTADFHFGSMRAQILPITFTNVNYNTAGRFLIFKMNGGDMQKNLSALQQKWAKVLPGIPFEYHFMDDALKKVYTSELQLKKAAFIATILAIIIVLIGIVGLIALSIQKRQKEIGIRKVLGSSALGITRLFLKDFLGVIFIASLIAVPLAYLLMHRWLNDYAYRINISFSPFIISIGLLTLVTVSLIILQTIKAAFANPMKSLRSE